MKERRHMCMNIEGALRRKNLRGLMTHDDGSPATDREAREYMKLKQLEGFRVLPMDGCDNFDKLTGCKGHPIPEESP